MAYNDKKIRKEIGAFLQQYKRKTKNAPYPNDRGYDRKIERKIKKMKPEKLQEILFDDLNDD